MIKTRSVSTFQMTQQIAAQTEHVKPWKKIARYNKMASAEKYAISVL
jgi:hypothetical protein